MAEKDPREFLVKSKLYRFASLLFVTIGIFVFCALYIQNVEGRLLTAIKDPLTIFVFLFPFLPAALLSFLADKAEKKYRDTINSNKK
jgi:hypothetical protein